MSAGIYTLYLIRCQDFLKFGITGEFDRRMAAYRGHCPIQIDIIHVFNFVSRGSARKAEIAIHKHFRELSKDFRMDWFSGSTDQEAIQVGLEIINSLGGEEYSPDVATRDRTRKSKKDLDDEAAAKQSAEDAEKRSYVERVIPSVLTPSIARWFSVSPNKARDIGKGRVHLDKEMIDIAYDRLTNFQTEDK